MKLLNYSERTLGTYDCYFFYPRQNLFRHWMCLWFSDIITNQLWTNMTKSQSWQMSWVWFWVWCCSRAFYDKRLSQEVSGDALGEVIMCTNNFHFIYFSSKLLLRLSVCRSSRGTFSRSWEVATSKVSQWNREFSPLVVSAFCFTEVLVSSWSVSLCLSLSHFFGLM